LPGEFFDSSAIAKIYHVESGTEQAIASWVRANTRGRAYISRLSVVEVLSALTKKVREGIISSADLEKARDLFRLDIRNKKWTVTSVKPGDFKRAASLIEHFGVTQRLRTLDAIQLAVADDLHARGLIDTLVSSDRIICATASSLNLTVFNPQESLQAPEAGS
jgi:predicted nucleic acid-binding protein